jgi:plastocyanin
MKSLRILTVLALTGVVVAGMAAVAVAQAPDAVKVVKVSIEGFTPAEITIAKGDIIRWEWESGTHTIKSGEPDSEDAGKVFEFTMNLDNKQFPHTFDDVGSYPYFDTSNPTQLRGVITVQAATPITPATWGFLKRVFEGSPN